MAAMIQRELTFSINPPIFRGGIIILTGFLINAEQNDVRQLVFQVGGPVFTERVVMRPNTDVFYEAQSFNYPRGNRS